MLEIERELQNDITGEYKASILTKLRITTTEVCYELQHDLASDEVEKLTKLLQALELSIKLVEQYEN